MSEVPEFCGMYEYHDSFVGKSGKGSHKFYEIVPSKINHGYFALHWGRVGTKGQWIDSVDYIKACGRADDKRRKGYTMIRHWDEYNNLIDSAIMENVAVTYDFMAELKGL